MGLTKRPVLLIAGGLFICLLILLNLFKGFQAAQERSLSALNRARLLTNPVLETLETHREVLADPEELALLLQPLLAQNDLGLEIIDLEGQILFDSNKKNLVAPTIGLRERLSLDYNAQAGGVLRMGVPLFDEDSQFAHAVLYLPQKTFFSETTAPFYHIAPVALVMVLVIIGFCYFRRAHSRTFSAPLEELSQALASMAKGNYSASLTIAANGELAKVSQIIDRLRLDLKDSSKRFGENKRRHEELTTKIYHDLKTPVSAIKAYAEGLRDGIAGDAVTAEKYLRVLSSKADSLAGLIDDLLLHSLHGLEQLRVEMQEVYSGQLLKSILAPLTVPADSVRPLIVMGDLPDLLIKVDPLRVEQVVVNLVQNAQKYSPPDGKVIFSVSNEDQRLKISVRDEGPGIAPADLPRLFDPFFRGGLGNNEAEGAGLGLAICKDIVEEHGGEIWARNNEGPGSTFYFSLPKI